jgi:hypothetical protein
MDARGMGKFIFDSEWLKCMGDRANGCFIENRSQSEPPKSLYVLLPFSEDAGSGPFRVFRFIQRSGQLD